MKRFLLGLLWGFQTIAIIGVIYLMLVVSGVVRASEVDSDMYVCNTIIGEELSTAKFLSPSEAYQVYNIWSEMICAPMVDRYGYINTELLRRVVVEDMLPMLDKELKRLKKEAKKSK